MMLKSDDEWHLSDLQQMKWIPRVDGVFAKFSEAILPTKEMVSFFGPHHPYFMKTNLSDFDYTMIERATELKLNFDGNNISFLVDSIIRPETVWNGFEGFDVLKQLVKLIDEYPEHAPPMVRRNRLPNSEGIWNDGSWLVPDEHSSDYTLIFQDQNIVTPEDLGERK